VSRSASAYSPRSSRGSSCVASPPEHDAPAHRSRALRLCFAWLAPPLWVIHAMINPSMSYEPRAEWLLNARPIIGYFESVVTMPFALSIPQAQWVGDNKLMLWPWVLEALISLCGMVLLAMTARLFFVAAAQSPRTARSEYG
jgi:hypothetical protein